MKKTTWTNLTPHRTVKPGDRKTIEIEAVEHTISTTNIKFRILNTNTTRKTPKKEG